MRQDCATCLGGGVCEPIWAGVSGGDACAMLEANVQNYQFLCINLAVSLGDVGACLSRDAPGCTFDTGAIRDPSALRANLRFVDDATCREALDACLVSLHGSEPDPDGGCDGCDCGGCDCEDESAQVNDGCGPQTDGCGDGCGDGGGCNDDGGGGGCGGGGQGGSCSVAGTSATQARNTTGLVWVLLPVPAALLARRRLRRATVAAVLEPLVEPPTHAAAAADEPTASDDARG